ncbi:ATP-NAD kinase [Haloarculaceae archaeon H-GB2-1]|nr:ATP-NAD kinase [Haloarculaceae archaeon H-GB1-1]MEA5385908.1 ATP-NAD kinase [Haloarculaceae archaeon H-GB11]MEA5407415.1 ATP-NAD kinase [Haloarculaceae archaeon H-GB2-1]
MDDRVDGVTSVGVVGPDGDSVAEAVTAAGLTPRTGAVEDVLATEPGALVAVGESALLSLARTGPDVPILPVDAGRGVRSVPKARVGAALEDITGDWRTERHPVLEVRVDGESVARALMDVTLTTAEPAHISEYTVSWQDERICQVRADGVVIGTPAGSHGYARAAGGPLVPPETDVAILAPMAPFETDPDHWVVPLTELELGVARDTTAVELLADDRVVADVPPTATVTVTIADSVALVRSQHGDSPFETD